MESAGPDRQAILDVAEGVVVILSALALLLATFVLGIPIPVWVV